MTPTAPQPGQHNAHELARARAVLPGGVNSPVRSFRAVGGDPVVVARAQGAHLYDVEGRAFIDYIGSWGAAILGHADPAVVDAVTRAARDGFSFGVPSRPETRLAEAIVARVPGAQRVRLVNSGTEAVMSAVRLARAATARSTIVKFDGGYHGHADALLVRAGSGVATLGLPDSPGVTPGAAHDTLVVGFNDADAVARALRTHDVAAVVVEPVAGNMGLVPPAPGFLESLRSLTAAHGALLVFDEVMTGFRLATGGAAERYAVTPDLSAFGKIIGGGLPVGAYAGPAPLMDLVAPAGPVYQAGTFSGNPMTTAAGLATLERLTPDAYARLERASDALEQGLRASMARRRVPGVVNRVGSMLSVFFGVERVASMDDARRASEPLFAAFFHAMLERGVHLPPGAFESWFVSLAHDDAVIDRTLAAADESLAGLSA